MRYEIRAMSFGEILDAGFQLLRNHFSLLVGLSLVLYLPIGLLNVLLEAMGQSPGEQVDPAAIVVTALPLVLTIIVAAPIVGAAITFAVGHLYLGQEVTFEGSLRKALAILLPLIGTSLLGYAAVFVGFVFLVVPGIYLGFAFFLMGQVMVLEQIFGTAALRRSHELMKGNKLRAFGVMLIGGILVGILSTGLQLILGLVPYLGTLAGSVAQAIGAVYTSAIAVVLYFDIRCRKEAFDLQHLAELVQQRAGGAPPAPSALP